jgi:hypothetical protein
MFHHICKITIKMPSRDPYLARAFEVFVVCATPDITMLLTKKVLFSPYHHTRAPKPPLSIPNEVLAYIVSHVELETLKCFRLANSEYREAGKQASNQAVQVQGLSPERSSSNRLRDNQAPMHPRSGPHSTVSVRYRRLGLFRVQLSPWNRTSWHHGPTTATRSTQ